jgi:hypothetical protein
MVVIPGLRQEAHPGMTSFNFSFRPRFVRRLLSQAKKEKNLTAHSLFCPSCQCVAAVDLDRGRKSAAPLTSSRPERGVGHRHERWARGAMDAKAATDERGLSGRRSRVVLTPDAGVTFVMMLRITRATVANKLDHRGERDISRKAIAQGRPDCFR